jgi:WD40 repeat protein
LSVDGDVTLEAPPRPHALGRGQILGGRYRLDELLGRGGMGEVWRAWDLTLCTDVALKALLPSTIPTSRDRARVRTEVLAARKVISPHVCRVFDLYEADGQQIISMELIDGKTLREILLEEPRISPARAHDIATQLLAGLAQIHDARLVHRDLKPGNVMITRGGRVVITDFGLACVSGEGTTAAGTPAYIAPEQALGRPVDARADLYATGMIFAEMIGGDLGAARAFARAVSPDPSLLTESTWAPILRKALREDPNERYASSEEILADLEKVALRSAGEDDGSPFPGLSPFTEANARYFFGRELEVEQLWRRIGAPRLQAVIGPSGAGKSSFLRAGVVASAPPGWRIVISTPGSNPFRNLARALAPELRDTPGAMEELLRFDEPEVAVSVIGRWRAQNEHAIVVIDQFEELFTQNPPDEQDRFARLLGALPVHAGTHAIVAIREDFFFRCADHPALAPLFSEPLPIRSPSRESLRRALIEPALLCGYRFEDEALVEEIVDAVEGERSALPLLAFAAAQLWERRDREARIIGRAAYEAIGGVGGALGRHAEATLGGIGAERLPIVREVFRNLITAEQTRVVRARQELLSVFDPAERAAVDEVLDALIDARLLNSYEPDEASGGASVEIVHESLLTQWPRLERWRTQDAEWAGVREELRQAAKVWNQHGRDADFLWTGVAYREFELWRERYPGGLTELEEAFASAMTAMEKRRRTRVRAAWVTALAATLLLAVGFGMLWRRGVEQTRLAESEAKRAAASELLAFGQAALETDRTAALAYAIASLKLADSREARLFALEVLSSGPPAMVSPEGPEIPWPLRFSPDGAWLAAGYWNTALRVYPEDGGSAVELGFAENTGISFPQFNREGSLLLGSASNNPEIRIWSVPEWQQLWSIEHGESVDEGMTAAAWGGEPGEVITFRAHSGFIRSRTQEGVIRRWSRGGGATPLGLIELNTAPTLDPTGTRVGVGLGRELRVHDLDHLQAPPLFRAEYPEIFKINAWPAFDARGTLLAACDEGGNVGLWSLLDDSKPLRWIRGSQGDGALGTALAADGSRLCIAFGSVVRVWSLMETPGADPITLGDPSGTQMSGCAVHPSGQVVATQRGKRLALWNTGGRQARIFRGHDGGAIQAVFSADGADLYSLGAKDGKVLRWPLHGAVGDDTTLLLQRSKSWGWGLTIDPSGRYLIATFIDGVWKIPLKGGVAERVTGLDTALPGAVAASGARRMASSHYLNGPTWRLQVRDEETGESLELGSEEDGVVSGWGFDARDSLVIVRGGKLQVWDPETGAITRLIDSGAWGLSLSPDRRKALTEVDGANTLVDLERGSSRSQQLSPATGALEGPNRNPVPRTVLGPEDTVVNFYTRDMLRVGRFADGGEPHLLAGHGSARRLAISPDGRWVAAATAEGVALWPMPDLDEPPLHALPHDELIAKLEALTNVRAIPDEASPNGYRIDIDDAAWRGWAKPERWP